MPCGPNRGAVLLRAYLRKHRLSQSQAATRLSIAKSYVGLLSTGNATPSLAVAIRLEEVTRIPCRAWYQAADPKELA